MPIKPKMRRELTSCINFLQMIVAGRVFNSDMREGWPMKVDSLCVGGKVVKMTFFPLLLFSSLLSFLPISDKEDGADLFPNSSAK